jgi:hypothetical protein
MIAEIGGCVQWKDCGDVAVIFLALACQTPPIKLNQQPIV